jgi:hypothetical protein
MSIQLSSFPDIEVELIGLFAPKFPSYRITSKLPGQFTGIAVRVHKISGANRDITIDRPIVDVDVFSTTGEADASTAARAIQAALRSLAGTQTANGVIQRATTVSGPRWLPDSNQTITRYGATYEIHIRAVS